MATTTNRSTPSTTENPPTTTTTTTTTTEVGREDTVDSDPLIVARNHEKSDAQGEAAATVDEEPVTLVNVTVATTGPVTIVEEPISSFTTRLRATLLTLFAIVSFSNSVAGAYLCQLLKYETVDEVGLEFGAIHGSVPSEDYPTIQTGLLTRNKFELVDVSNENGTSIIYYEKTCKMYNREVLDPYDDPLWEGAIVVKNMAWTCIQINLLILLLGACGCKIRYAFHVTSAGFLLAFVFETLSLMVLGSDLCKDNAVIHQATYFDQPVYHSCKLGDDFSYVLFAMIGFLSMGLYNLYILRDRTRYVIRQEETFVSAAQVPLLQAEATTTTTTATAVVI